MKQPDPQDWTRYWQRPTITSFGDMFPNNYDDTMLEFWQGQLTGELEHVVDIACGNGALSWIADDILNSGARKTRVTGVDFADIKPFRVLGKKQRHFPEVRFIGNTPAEELPFEDQSIDLVISQYGVEYTNLDETIPEIARVLVPAGRMSFILHDKESVIIKGATDRLEDCRTVLIDIAIHKYALELDALCRRITNPRLRQQSPEHRRLVLKINSLANQVRALVQGYPARSSIHQYMERLNEALAHARNNKNVDRKAMIMFARDALRAHIERVEDLEAAALSDEGRRHLVSLVENAGFTVTEQAPLPFRNDDNVGSVFVAQR